jgi:4-hydroxy-3-methylbut-2-enyl diphosphate reductase
LAVIVTGFYTFGLVYIRSTLSDIRDIHGDKLVGRETIPILIGKNPTKVFLGVLTVLVTGLLISSTAMGWTTSFGYLFLLTAPYTALYLWLYHMRLISRGIRLDLVLDGVFHLAGLLAIIWLLSGASAF